jgi:hypothetical protein
MRPVTTAVTPRPPRAGRFAGLAALAVLALLAAGCATGQPPPPSPAPATRGPTASPFAPGDAVGTATPRPTEVPGPPQVALAAAGSAPVDGALGTFTWDGAGSDAPWIVPSAVRAVGGRGPFSLTFQPPLSVERWSATWAPVASDGAGAPVGGVAGTGAVLVVGSVPGPGTWGLAVRARFGAGREATWFWRVEPGP